MGCPRGPGRDGEGLRRGRPGVGRRRHGGRRRGGVLSVPRSPTPHPQKLLCHPYPPARPCQDAVSLIAPTPSTSQDCEPRIFRTTPWLKDNTVPLPHLPLDFYPWPALTRAA